MFIVVITILATNTGVLQRSNMLVDVTASLLGDNCLSNGSDAGQLVRSRVLIMAGH